MLQLQVDALQVKSYLQHINLNMLQVNLDLLQMTDSMLQINGSTPPTLHPRGPR